VKGNNIDAPDFLSNLRKALNTLAQKIEPKVYQYGFLLGEGRKIEYE